MCAAQSSPPENIVVDGKLSEWANPLPRYDKQTMLYYDVHNDKEFLYIALKRAKSGDKIKGEGRMVFEFAPSGDSNGLKITYPATGTNDAVDMWNYLQVRPVNSRGADTVTIYNDYGIQAGGRYWTYETLPERRDRINLIPDASQMITTVGADCELAIPLKLLPATADSYTIKIILSGMAGMPGVKEVLASISEMNLPKEDNAIVVDGMVVTSLSITYHLK
jgi:hypothetical protein